MDAKPDQVNQPDAATAVFWLDLAQAVTVLVPFSLFVFGGAIARTGSDASGWNMIYAAIYGVVIAVPVIAVMQSLRFIVRKMDERE